MKKRNDWLNITLILTSLLAACTTPTPSPTVPAPTTLPQPTVGPTAAATQPPVVTAEAPKAEDAIYLSIIWHQHQPVYFKDPETGNYARPWVRVHAAKDYVDMAAILKEYPAVHATFNLTPSLIRQLDDFAAGAKDLYWTHAEIPADELTDEEKQFILDRFFDINPKIIDRFPRYGDLAGKRNSSDDPVSAYETQDFLDLQVLFNLAWTDPDWLDEAPLAALVSKGENFSEEDKQIVFGEHLRLIQEVIPVHRELQDAGQIEVTMTPFAHPILPLLVTTDLAREALPDISLPDQKFVYGQDAVAQVELGVQLYEAHFGRPPRGMWPAEGSVAQEIVSMVAENGIQWIASDEGVLANSLGFPSFTRDSREVVVEADTLYRPYYVQGSRGGPVAMVFRDVVISDKVGFTYSGLPGELAATDFINRIHAIREELIASGADGPHLVSVILDGENAWEHYENDGKEFLRSLYRQLTDDPFIVTVTPSEFLEIAPEQPAIEDLWAGSWIGHDFSTWIGEEEENRGWDYLATTREFLQRYISGSRQDLVDPETLAEATILMYIAEGSDWFWWLGADQNSGSDGAFDQQFRDTMKQVYLTLGEEPPGFLDVPLIPQQAVSADTASTALISPAIDGVIREGEWDAGGTYFASGGVMAEGQPFFGSLTYGFDSKTLFINVTLAEAFEWPTLASSLEIYLSAPGGGDVGNFSRAGSLLGFPANRLAEVQLEGGNALGANLLIAGGDDNWEPGSALEQVALGPGVLELGIPLTLLGNADVGDRLTLRAIYNETIEVSGASSLVDADQLPGTGPAVVAVPDLGTTTVLVDIADPANDDHGPGSYTYPEDAVFHAGNFDVLNFQVGFDEQNVVFKFTMRGAVDNPWGSPNGLAVQTFDIYVDEDGDGNGGPVMLPGRNLAFQDGFAWDFAITAEGWEPGVFVPGAEGPEQVAEAAQFQILADPGQQKVTIRVPKSILGDNPEAWRYAAVSLGQEGFPAGGVMRVRDVNPASEQWRFGGAPASSTNHTRVIDMVWATEGEQEGWLGEFTVTDTPQTELAAEDFATVPMFEVGG